MCQSVQQRPPVEPYQLWIYKMPNSCFRNWSMKRSFFYFNGICRIGSVLTDFTGCLLLLLGQICNYRLQQNFNRAQWQVQIKGREQESCLHSLLNWKCHRGYRVNSNFDSPQWGPLPPQALQQTPGLLQGLLHTWITGCTLLWHCWLVDHILKLAIHCCIFFSSTYGLNRKKWVPQSILNMDLGTNLPLAYCIHQNTHSGGT